MLITLCNVCNAYYTPYALEQGAKWTPLYGVSLWAQLEKSRYTRYMRYTLEPQGFAGDPLALHALQDALQANHNQLAARPTNQ